MTKRAVIYAGLCAVWILAAPSRTFGEGASSPPRELCAINEIYGTFSSGGFLAATGFAFDLEGAPVRKVELVVDGSIVGEVSLSGLRPDVLAHFARQDYLWSGWNGTVSLAGVRPGRHLVRIVAIGHEGKVIPCGERTFEVSAGIEVRNREPFRIGLEIVLRSLALLLWLTLIGWAPASLSSRGLPLSAPLLGLAIFGIVAETAAQFHVRPFQAAVALTLAAAVALAALWRTARLRLRAPSRMALLAIAGCAAFLVVAVVPLASHGEGAVLGDIDDAVRECAVADSIASYGWKPPPDVRGYLVAMPDQVGKVHIRRGGPYLLSALAEAFGTRAHAVYSAAMIAAAVLIVAGSALLALRVLPGIRETRWATPVLVALNSVLLATLYGQHLGVLLGVALYCSFLFYLPRLSRRRLTAGTLQAALATAGALTLYPETLGVWALSGILFVLLAGGRGRVRRAAARLVVLGLLTIALNPFGLLRAGRFGSKAVMESGETSSPYRRLIAGDTHYFPDPGVVSGVRAFREDAPAPVGSVRSILIPVACAMILAVVVFGWNTLLRCERRMTVVFLLPLAIALLANYAWNFPYGFGKYLLLAVPVWAAVFVFFVSRLLRAGPGQRRGPKAVLAGATLVLVLGLSIPAARHVWRRAVRAVPAYDAAFRVLPALAAAAGRDATIVVNEPFRARREWLVYFVGENPVELVPRTADSGGARRLLLVDRRKSGGALPRKAVVATRVFALVPPPPPETP